MFGEESASDLAANRSALGASASELETNGSTPSAPVAQSGLSAGEAAIVAIFVDLAHALGSARSVGEIYGLLYASARPLAFQEICDKLSMSKGSASQGLRFLRSVGAVKTVYVTGDRKDYFEPVVELRQLVSGFLRERMEPQLTDWGNRMETLTPAAFGDQLSPDERKRVGERIDKLKKWQSRAGTVLPIIARLVGK